MFHVKHLGGSAAGNVPNARPRDGHETRASDWSSGTATCGVVRGAACGVSGATAARRGDAEAPGTVARPGRSHWFCRLLGYAFTAPYFDLFSTSTAAIISTTPTIRDTHGLPVKPAIT